MYNKTNIGILIMAVGLMAINHHVQASDAEGFHIYPADNPNEGILFVNHQQRGGSGHNGQALLEYQKDHILAFYLRGSTGEETLDGHHPLGWTEYRRSTDGGKSWGAPKVLAYSKYLYDHSDYFSGYVKQVVLAPDGSIVAIGCRFLEDYPKFDSAFYVRSHDGGSTWEEARIFGMDDPVFGRPQASHVHNETIYVLFTHGPTWGNNAPHRLYVSNDNGATFTRRSDLTLDDACWYGAMARLDNGAIIAYGYRERDEHNLQYVISEDDGHTWSSPKTTYLAKKIRNPIMSEKIGDYYFMHGRGGYPEPRQNLVLYSSMDGIHWDEGRYLRVGPGTYAYSNNAVVGRFDTSSPSRLLIQSSVAYDNQRKVNVHHWWVGTEPGSLDFIRDAVIVPEQILSRKLTVEAVDEPLTLDTLTVGCAQGTFRSNRSLEEWVDIGWVIVPTPHLGGLGTIRTLWDDDSLYLIVRAEKQIGDRHIPPEPVATSRDDTRIFMDDCVRIFLQPGKGSAIFQIAVNQAGTVWTGERRVGKIEFDTTWNADGIDVGAKDEPGYYEVRLKIPFTTLGAYTPSIGDTWHANILRTERPSQEETSWSGTKNFGDDPAMGVWVFSAQTEQHTLRGKVIERHSGLHIAGVFLETPEGIIRSDANGEFEITTSGRGTMPIRAAGFQYETVEITINIDQSNDVEIHLVRLSDDEIQRKLDALASEHGRHPEISIGAEMEDLASARANNQPGFEYSPMFRIHQCCPIGLALLDNGRMLVSYTAFGICHGHGRDRGNMTFIDASDDGGKTWHTLAVFSNGWRTPWGNFFHDPRGRLWLFIHRQVLRCDNPGQSPMEWIDLGLIGDDLHPRLLGTSIPIVLDDGTWLYTVARHEGGTSHVDFFASTNEGETWYRRGSAYIPEEMRNTPEPMTVQRKDDSLWMLARVQGGFIGESFSYDNGTTWTDVTHSPIQHTTSRFDIRRLQSGRLLLIKHPDGAGRVDMTAYLSEDDGRTWPYSLQLHNGMCSYPDAAESADGLLHIVYDVGRYSDQHDTSIRMAKIREADILAGELVSDDAELNIVIVRAGPYSDSSQKFSFAWSMPEQILNLIEISKNAPQAQPYKKDAVLFTDRNYTAHEIPKPLSGGTFLQLPIDGGQHLRMPKPGMLYIVTATEEHLPEGSQITLLREQGFEQIDHPPFALDSSDSFSQCVIMKKEMQAGETVSFEKWAVPVFFK